MYLKVHPLSLGTLRMSGAVLMRLNHFEEDSFPCLGFVITGGDKTIMVDTGAPEPDCNAKTPREVVRSADEYLIPQLTRLGLQPEDIDIVINTHLHWDHIYGNNKLPRAEILVQQAELDYFANPLPCDRNSYEKNSDIPFATTFLDRVLPVRGDASIIPGVRVLLTPGHTPGCQSVLVETVDGLVVLPGDNISLLDSLKVTPPHLPGIVVDAYDFYNSMEKLSRLGPCRIMPAHEKSILNKHDCSRPVSATAIHGTREAVASHYLPLRD